MFVTGTLHTTAPRPSSPQQPHLNQLQGLPACGSSLQHTSLGHRGRGRGQAAPRAPSMPTVPTHTRCQAEDVVPHTLDDAAAAAAAHSVVLAVDLGQRGLGVHAVCCAGQACCSARSLRLLLACNDCCLLSPASTTDDSQCTSASAHACMTHKHVRMHMYERRFHGRSAPPTRAALPAGCALQTHSTAEGTTQLHAPPACLLPIINQPWAICSYSKLTACTKAVPPLPNTPQELYQVCEHPCLDRHGHVLVRQHRGVHTDHIGT
jgi:hypothetical protein